MSDVFERTNARTGVSRNRNTRDDERLLDDAELRGVLHAMGEDVSDETHEERRRLAVQGDDIIVLTTMIVLCTGVGILGGLPIHDAVDGWYATLSRPFFEPPAAVLAPIWTVLLVLAGFAGWRIMRSPYARAVRAETMGSYAVVMMLTTVWPWAFFAARDPLLALVVMVVLIDAAIFCVRRFARLDGYAALLMMPLVGWLIFEGVLNYAVAALN